MRLSNYVEVLVLAALVMAVYLGIGSLPKWIDRFAAGGGGGRPTVLRKGIGVALVALLTGGFVLGHWYVMGDAETVPYVAAVVGVVGLLMVVIILRRKG